jgi:hypothetical protein
MDDAWHCVGDRKRADACSWPRGPGLGRGVTLSQVHSDDKMERSWSWAGCFRGAASNKLDGEVGASHNAPNKAQQ